MSRQHSILLLVLAGTLVLPAWLSLRRERPGVEPPRAPNPWFFVERAYPQGRIPLAEWRKAQLEARALREAAEYRPSSFWRLRGPTNIGGRVTDVAVSPENPDVVYAAAAEGGVLRSTDAGQSWTPLFDDQPSLSVGAVAIDPTNPAVIYAGTGEVNPGGGSVAYGGAGLFRSTDAGATWASLGLENTGAIGRIVIDPTDSNRIFVAAMGQLWENNPERGVYRTTDGGASWSRVLFANDSTGCVDVVQRPDNPNVLFAALWERVRRPEYYRYGGQGSGVYRSTDGGTTWGAVGGGLSGFTATTGRIGLSLCASEPSVMHAVLATSVGNFAGLYRSTTGGATWTRTNDGSLINSFSSYGWWFGNIRTHPVDPNTIFVLGLTFHRSTDGGASFQDLTGIVHPDQHGLGFGPGPNPVLYLGNDGGVYRSPTNGSTWSKLPDLPISQIYRIALDRTRPAAVYAGLQDNGTCRTLTGEVDAWEDVFGGDGFQPLVHPTDSNRLWVQYQYGNVYYSGDGGGSWTAAGVGIAGTDRRNWNSPHALDPGDPSRRYFGTHRLYRSTSETIWTPISPDLTGGPHLGNSGQVNGTLTTIAVSPVDGNVVWTGSDDGRVHVTKDGGTSWTNVSAGLPDRWITAVRPDPVDRDKAYATISGFRWGEPLPHVFRTTDSGAHWLAVAGNLPEAPVNDLLVDPLHPQRLFVATDVGMFQSIDGGATWSMMGADLPHVVVTSLALETATRTLVAGTYGRSIFSCAIGSATDVAPVPPSNALGLRIQPNPMRDAARFNWEASANSPATVEVFSVAGRRLWSATARGQVQWDGRDSRGQKLPPAPYYARVFVAGRSGTQTFVISR